MDMMHDKEIKRTYVVENFSKGMVRAWHCHLKGDTYLHVINGAAKVAALKYSEDGIRSGLHSGEPQVSVITARKPQLFYIPRGFYNGACSLTDNTRIIVYSTLSFDEVADDDFRLTSEVYKEIWETKSR